MKKLLQQLKKLKPALHPQTWELAVGVLAQFEDKKAQDDLKMAQTQQLIEELLVEQKSTKHAHVKSLIKQEVAHLQRAIASTQTWWNTKLDTDKWLATQFNNMVCVHQKQPFLNNQTYDVQLKQGVKIFKELLSSLKKENLDFLTKHLQKIGELPPSPTSWALFSWKARMDTPEWMMSLKHLDHFVRSSMALQELLVDYKSISSQLNQKDSSPMLLDLPLAGERINVADECKRTALSLFQKSYNAFNLQQLGSSRKYSLDWLKEIRQSAMLVYQVGLDVLDGSPVKIKKSFNVIEEANNRANQGISGLSPRVNDTLHFSSQSLRFFRTDIASPEYKAAFSARSIKKAISKSVDMKKSSAPQKKM